MIEAELIQDISSGEYYLTWQFQEHNFCISTDNLEDLNYIDFAGFMYSCMKVEQKEII